MPCSLLRMHNLMLSETFDISSSLIHQTSLIYIIWQVWYIFRFDIWDKFYISKDKFVISSNLIYSSRLINHKTCLIYRQVWYLKIKTTSDVQVRFTPSFIQSFTVPVIQRASEHLNDYFSRSRYNSKSAKQAIEVNRAQTEEQNWAELRSLIINLSSCKRKPPQNKTQPTKAAREITIIQEFIRYNWLAMKFK